MSDQTANLALPYILPSQAQKHVTHNEALQRLDAVVQLTVTDERASPPSAPAEGECYLVAAAAGGEWTGKAGQLAFRQDGVWIYLTPRRGWRAFFLIEQALCIFADGSWSSLPLPADAAFSTIAIRATADAVNRLALSSPASLFTHDGHGHQVKVNKAAAPDVASLLFQTGWSGRAEMGLAGSDDFSIKVSGDGESWQTALKIAPDGLVEMPARPAVRASPAATAPSPANGARTGFADLHLQQGGFTLGAVVPSGSGNRLVVSQTGLYLLILSISTLSSSGHGAALEANGVIPLARITGPASAAPGRQTALGLARLEAGDWLSLSHSGAAQYEFGSGKTEVSAIFL
ncbi:DUF2793 domain-containing protein [Rhizobium binxianense]